MLSACSYDSETAVKNGDVINMHGPVYNFHRFERFLDNIEAKEAASVRIANYTLEGCQQDSTVESFIILSVMKEQVEDHEH